MSAEPDEALNRLADGIGEERATTVLEAADALREHVAALLAEARLEPEDPLLRKRRRLHHRLEVIEAKAEAGRFEDAEEDREEVAVLARELTDAIEERPPAEDTASEASDRRRAWLLAKRETRERWRRVTVVGVLALSVVALTVQARAGAVAPLLALASLGGVVAGAGVIGEDAEAGRLHLVVGHGSSRAAVVAAKLAATVGLLAAAFVASAFAGGLAGWVLGVEVDWIGTGVWGLGLALVAGAFVALVAGLEATGRSACSSIVAGVLAYLVLGPIWRSAFLAGREAGGELASLGAQALYSASPVAAGRHLLEAPDLGRETTAGLLVLFAWILVLATVAAVLAERRGFEPTRQHN